MAASIWDWSVVAANNSNADADLTWAEGQAPSTVNNSARVMMQRNKQFLVDIGGSIAAGGTANGLTVTASSPFATLADGLIVAFRATASNTGAATLNVNGVGAKAIRKMNTTGDVALIANEICNTGVYIAQYSAALNGAAGAWLLVNPTPGAFVPIGGLLDYAGPTAPSYWLLCYGQAISRTTYAALFAVLSTTHGPGDGSTTFNLPDYRGRVGAGQDDMGGSSANRLTGLSGGVDGDVLGDTGGLETHTLTTAQLAVHAHTLAYVLDTSAAAHNVSAGTVPGSSSPTPSATTGTAVQSAGSGNAHNNVQPTIILNKIIYAGA